MRKQAKNHSNLMRFIKPKVFEVEWKSGWKSSDVMLVVNGMKIKWTNLFLVYLHLCMDVSYIFEEG